MAFIQPINRQYCSIKRTTEYRRQTYIFIFYYFQKCNDKIKNIKIFFIFTQLIYAHIPFDFLTQPGYRDPFLI